MNSNEIKKAIDFCNEEIKSLELAPEINGCEMKKEWQEQIDIYKTIISAFDLINQYEAEIERLEKDSKRLKKVHMQLDNLCIMHNVIKAEAIKEFAERLIEKAIYMPIWNGMFKSKMVGTRVIKDLLKEMGVE